MSIIEQIAGYIPAVRERAKAFLDFAQSTKGKVILAAVLAASVIGYAYHVGANSQQPKIAALEKKLTLAEAAAARPNIAEVHKQVTSKTWLEDQAKALEALNLKVKQYEEKLAKDKPVAGDLLTESDARWLLRIK